MAFIASYNIILPFSDLPARKAFLCFSGSTEPVFLLSFWLNPIGIDGMDADFYLGACTQGKVCIHGIRDVVSTRTKEFFMVFVSNQKTAILALRDLLYDISGMILYRKRRNFCRSRCFFHGKRRYFHR